MCRELRDINGLTRRRLVLLERIELSTSPLPRECSTTELPQRVDDPLNRGGTGALQRIFGTLVPIAQLAVSVTWNPSQPGFKLDMAIVPLLLMSVFVAVLA